MELQRQWCEQNGVPFEPYSGTSPTTSASEFQGDMGPIGNGALKYRRANTADEGALSVHEQSQGQPSPFLHKSRSMEIFNNAGNASPIANTAGRRTPTVGESNSSGGIQAPRRRVATSWIGNLKTMVRPAQTIDSPQSDAEPGQAALFVDDDEEPSGLQDDEISQLESLLFDLEAKERELDGVHLELLTTTQDEDDAALAPSTGADNSAQRRPTAAAGAATNDRAGGGGGAKSGGQEPSRGPAIIHQTEESGPRGVCESPSSSEGPEDSSSAGARLRAAAIARQLQQSSSARGGGGGSREGRQRKAWKTLFASRVRKLEKELRSLEEEDLSLDEIHAELRASVSPSPHLHALLADSALPLALAASSPASVPPASAQATPDAQPPLQAQTV